MEIPILLILLCCSSYSVASHNVQTIPIENYETELQVLGEHVEYPETPVRVVKITKTVAVKVPVPYPVKVIEKVPYPVHINKPYPVPVPHLVKVPHVESPPKIHAHEALGAGDHGNAYQVQEGDGHIQEGGHGDSYGPEIQSFYGGNSGHSQGFTPYNEDYSSEVNSYEAPSQNYHGNAGGHGVESFESGNYNAAKNHNYYH